MGVDPPEEAGCAVCWTDWLALSCMLCPCMIAEGHLFKVAVQSQHHDCSSCVLVLILLLLPAWIAAPLMALDGPCRCSWIDAGKFLTGFSAVGSLAIPAILAHAKVRVERMESMGGWGG